MITDTSMHRLDENIALRKFQSNQLHDDDRYWHTVVPEDGQKRLSSKEQGRQKEIFGIIASEQHYVSDLELWLTVRWTVSYLPHIVPTLLLRISPGLSRSLASATYNCPNSRFGVFHKGGILKY